MPALSRFQILKQSASAATYNMILQLFLKIISFSLNMVVIRHTSKEMLGIVNIRLMLLQSTVLFLCTEGIDSACLSRFKKKNWTQVINMMWLTFPLSVICGVTCGWVWLSVFDVPDEDVIPNYHIGVIGFVVAPIVVTFARPLFLVGQSFFFVKLRVASVAISEALKCGITALLLLWYPSLGIITFAIAQVAGEAIYVVIYYIVFYIHIKTPGVVDKRFVFQSVRDFFPKSVPGLPYINGKMARLAFSFFKQSILKQMLTEGEKYVMTVFRVMSFADQGVFGIINNLGALIPRFVFQPIEESGRLFFSQLLIRGDTHSDQEKEEAKLAFQVLYYLLRSMALIGALMLVFGNCYAHLLLDLYGGKMLSDGSGTLLLQWFFVYVLFLAINGIMECFHFALMNQKDTDSYNKKMLLFSVVFLGSSLLFTRFYGGIGFILANCLTMSTRIFYSLLFVMDYYEGTKLNPLKALIPSLPLLLSLVVSFGIMKSSEGIFCCDHGKKFQLIHIGIGGVCFLVVMVVLYFTERDLRGFIVKHYSHETVQKTEEHLVPTPRPKSHRSHGTKHAKHRTTSKHAGVGGPTQGTHLHHRTTSKNAGITVSSHGTNMHHRGLSKTGGVTMPSQGTSMHQKARPSHGTSMHQRAQPSQGASMHQRSHPSQGVSMNQRAHPSQGTSVHQRTQFKPLYDASKHQRHRTAPKAAEVLIPPQKTNMFQQKSQINANDNSIPFFKSNIKAPTAYIRPSKRHDPPSSR